MDSGTSEHLTFERQKLRNYRSRESPLSMGRKLKLAPRGSWYSNQEQVELITVLYVREATLNVFSVKRAMNGGAQIIFKRSKCCVTMDRALCMQDYQQKWGEGHQGIRSKADQDSACGINNVTNLSARSFAPAD